MVQVPQIFPMTGSQVDLHPITGSATGLLGDLGQITHTSPFCLRFPICIKGIVTPVSQECCAGCCVVLSRHWGGNIRHRAGLERGKLKEGVILSFSTITPGPKFCDITPSA